MKKRFAIYARYSSHEQDGTHSIEDQTDACNKFVADEGGAVVKKYIDRAQSGRTEAREQYERLLQDALNTPKPFDAIVTWKFDRFGRSGIPSLINRAKIRKAGIEVLSTCEKFDPEDPTGELMEFILAGMDKAYSQRVSQDVLRGMRGQSKKGFVVGGTPLFGYRFEKIEDPEGKKNKDGSPKLRNRLLIVPSDAKIVRMIFDLYNDKKRNWGYARIAGYLNDKRIPSPGERQTNGSRRRRGKGWIGSAVKFILMNPTYTGSIVFGKTKKILSDETGKRSQRPTKADQRIVSHASHKPIIDQALFDATQKRIEVRASAFRNKDLDRHGLYKAKYSVTGLIECGVCGNKYVVSPKRMRFKSYSTAAKAPYRGPQKPKECKNGDWEIYAVVYECNGAKKKGPSICKNRRQVPLRALEAELCSLIKFKIHDPTRIARVEREGRRLFKLLISQSTKGRRSLEKERDSLKREVSSLIAHLQNTKNPGSVQAIDNALNEKQLRLDEIEAALAMPEVQSLDRKRFRELFNRRVQETKKLSLASQMDDMRAAFHKTLKVIQVYPDRVVVTAKTDQLTHELGIREDDPKIRKMLEKLWKRFETPKTRLSDTWIQQSQSAPSPKTPSPGPSAPKNRSAKNYTCRRRDLNPHEG